MDFRIADPFAVSVASLTGDVQKAVKTTAFDLQINPAGAGVSVHKLDKPADHPQYRLPARPAWMASRGHGPETHGC